ncbi:hypothetical protein [Paracraurococcus ruber]|uniref:ANTAR domain-containing protein n=1 Tax=Paracraurococcus ruber TaxID=77675 RepID=A0ABS1CXT8_9PROT|nr:hypothetical protein [Paracraurococcus ruber]MBK1659218.1 hypothetical protein [Paracraurococcus ruber]TDG14579.1 hypothetical protein E2C05_29810 [Paracraurococcus ruber]
MANARPQHPYLDLFALALVPRSAHGGDHSKDPPHLLPLTGGTPEAQAVLDLLSGADQDIRLDHERAAAINLDLAETRIRMAISHGDTAPSLQTALERIAQAREEMAKHDSRRACAALADALRAVATPH